MSARRILLGVGGGIAAFKVAALASMLVQRGHRVRVAMTRAAQEFVGARTFEGLTHAKAILTSTQVDLDGSAPHITEPNAADVYVIAPATADLIARLAAGVCDDPVTLAATLARCPRMFCPAMNDVMWNDAVVQRNAASLRALGFVQLGPVVGPLAEGYAGVGRMVEPEAIADAIEKLGV